MSVIQNISNVDPTSLSSNASLSSHPFKSIIEAETDTNQKLERTRRFRDIIKEKFSFSNTENSSSLKQTFSETDYLSKLQDDVYISGDALSDVISSENILAYKKSIKAFVEYVLDRAYKVENIVTGGLNPAKKKVWVIVKVINEKLDKLIADLMYNQLKKIDILKRIDEIKGLIVDLKG